MRSHSQWYGRPFVTQVTEEGSQNEGDEKSRVEDGWW